MQRQSGLAALCAAFLLAGCAGQHALSTFPSAAGQVHQRDPRHALATVTLAKYNVNPSKVFVAGISSGGFMAVHRAGADSGSRLPSRFPPSRDAG